MMSWFYIYWFDPFLPGGFGVAYPTAIVMMIAYAHAFQRAYLTRRR